MSLAIFHPHFVIRIFPSAFCHPHFSIRISSSAFFYPPFAIRRHPVRTLQRPRFACDCLSKWSGIFQPITECCLGKLQFWISKSMTMMQWKLKHFYWVKRSESLWQKLDCTGKQNHSLSSIVLPCNCNLWVLPALDTKIQKKKFSRWKYIYMFSEYDIKTNRARCLASI